MSQPVQNFDRVEDPQDGVKDAATAASTTPGAPTGMSARRITTRKVPPGRGGGHCAALAARVIRARSRRIAEWDVEGLGGRLKLREGLDAATQVAVTGLRGFGYPWAEIAARLGTTRQAAQQRWGR
ncbi:hypothetical protein [Kineosporia sp. A_224]|uniref:hypothetical protein n=1 Tax=Kineosporia sp. A_224 TaxID=1962180 RepID=UPI000B4A90E6|nr:hypothetical protein [Kineosporia sp. A_224]